MIRFKKYLTEKLIDVIPVKDWHDKETFVDIHENPTRAKLMMIQGSWARDYDAYYFGVWLNTSTKKWYIWPRSHFAHEDAYKKLPGKLSGAVPLYVFVTKAGKVKVQLSSWSDTRGLSKDDIEDAIEKVPSFKKAFPTISDISIN